MVTNPQALRIGLYNLKSAFTLAVEKPIDPDFLFFKDNIFFLESVFTSAHILPHVRVIQDGLGFMLWILDSGTGFQSLSVQEFGFRIPVVRGIPESLSCILDSASKNFLILKSGCPYMRQHQNYANISKLKTPWVNKEEEVGRAPYRYPPPTGLVTGRVKCHCKDTFDL